jgi:beta-carotene 3-hydroxylase
MAAGLSGATTMTGFAVKNPLLAAAAARCRALPSRNLPFSPFTRTPRRRGLETVTCFVPQVGQAPAGPAPEPATVPMPVPSLEEEAALAASRRLADKKARKQSERRTYLVAAVMSSLGVTSMAVASVYYRFAWQMEVRSTIRLGYLSSLPLLTSEEAAAIHVRRQLSLTDRCANLCVQGGEVPMTEMLGTFALSVGAAVS